MKGETIVHVLVNFLFIVSLVVNNCHAARRVDAKEELERNLLALGGESHRAKREARRLSVRDLLGSGPETVLEVKDESSTAQGTKLWKMEEKYRGREVFDTVVTVETDASGSLVLDVSGSVVQEIEKDTTAEPDIYPNAAVYSAVNEFKDDRARIRDVKVELKIFLDENELAFPGYMVQYLIEDEGKPRRPTAIVDGRDGRVVMHWNSLTTLCTAGGYGGNEKLGKKHYNGLDHKCLDMTVVGNNDICLLENAHVRVVDMRGETWSNITQTMAYDCVNATDGTNGGYSPGLDALYIGTAIGKLYQEWFGMKPNKKGKLIFRVHYGRDYPNAFWNGVNCTFGDGREEYGSFPFVSADLVGHEVGHAIIEQFSGLIWYQQPGALNEAFADITGEVIEHYISGQNDWLVGAEVIRGEGAYRYLDSPENNSFGISNANKFEDYMIPHESGGVLSHAFYRLVQLHGLGIKEVYKVFMHANRMYWHHMSTFKSGVCELMKSVYDLGQPGEVYKEVFEYVGIEVCDITNHVVGMRNNETYTNIVVSNVTRPIFTFGLPGEWTDKVWVRALSGRGDIHITISDKTWLSAYNPDEVSILAQGYGFAMFTVTKRDLYHVTVTLSSDSSEVWSDVTLHGGYSCLGLNQTSHGYFERLRNETCYR